MAGRQDGRTCAFRQPAPPLRRALPVTSQLLSPDESFTVIVLAAQRSGRVDPLAEDAGVSHRCLVPVLGVPLIRHVVAALVPLPEIAEVRVSAEPEAHGALREALAGLAVCVRMVASADNLADSLYRASEGAVGPLVVTTGDNALLTAGAVRQVLAPLRHGADGAVALASRASVLAAHPLARRDFHHFADDVYAVCNLYALHGPRAMGLAELFRTGGRFRQQPWRLAAAFGTITALLYWSHRLSVQAMAQRVSRRQGVDLRIVALKDGSHAIDVRSLCARTVAEELLARRTPRRPTFRPVLAMDQADA